jgi:hypothetical protein
MDEDLLIVPDDSEPSSRKPTPSTIPLRVETDRLVLTPTVANFLRRRNVVSARGFVSFLRATPDPLGVELGWSAQELRVLTARLLAVLRHVLPARALAKHLPPRRGYGAVIPRARLR